MSVGRVTLKESFKTKVLGRESSVEKSRFLSIVCASIQWLFLGGKTNKKEFWVAGVGEEAQQVTHLPIS